MIRYGLLLVFVVAIIAGCSSGHIGPRIGMNVAASGMEFTGPVRESSTYVGTIAGLTAGGTFGSVVGIEFAPQIRTIGGKARSSVVFDDKGTSYSSDMSYEGKLTILDLPFMVTFGKPLGESWRPYVGLGLVVSSITGGSTSSDGTVKAVSGPSAGTVIPLSMRSSYEGRSRDLGSIVLNAGTDYALSDAWALRFDARLLYTPKGQPIFIYGVGPAGSTAYVNQYMPTTNIGISASLLMKL